MRIYFANDTSAYHAGSAAVCRYLCDTLRAQGHQVEAEADRARVESPRIEACDGVLVNGEGTMHHDAPRARHLMAVLGEGQRLGKHTFLVNSLWQAMGGAYTETIRRLDQFAVREVLSAEEAEHETGRRPQVFLDFSYWAHQGVAQPLAQRSGVLATDFYSREFGCFVLPRGGWFKHLAPTLVDLQHASWEGACTQLAAAQCLLTGRHHAVYAAGRMRCPFAVMAGNSHKIAGLMATAAVPIPVAESFAELRAHFDEVSRRRSLFERLFDWMAAQPAWRGI